MDTESDREEDPMKLRLNLSLGLPDSTNNVIGNRSTSLSPPSPPAPQAISWNLLLPLPSSSLSDKSLDAQGQVGGGADVTGPPLPCPVPGSMGVFVDQLDDVSSPNSTVSSVSAGKHENDAERTTSCSRGSDEDDGGGIVGGEGRKKLRLSRDQSMVLEETFKEHSTLNPKQKQALADRLNLRPRQVEVWFQNRRARTKLKQTEVDCEYLKWCCENLTQENRRLQKEVQELRALKLNPQLYMNMNMNPPTTLTMCPSCERVATLSNSSSSPTSTVPVGSLSGQQSSINVFP